MLNIAVMVSGGGTNLQALLDAQARGELKSGRIALVVSSKEGAYALTRARAAGVETAVLARGEGETPSAYGQRLVALLRAHRIGLVVLAGFMLILDECVVNAYEGRILNVHPSLIPAFCGEGYYGLRVHRAALERGVKVTGATVHIVNAGPKGRGGFAWRYPRNPAKARDGAGRMDTASARNGKAGQTAGRE